MATNLYSLPNWIQKFTQYTELCKYVLQPKRVFPPKCYEYFLILFPNQAVRSATPSVKVVISGRGIHSFPYLEVVAADYH